MSRKIISDISPGEAKADQDADFDEAPELDRAFFEGARIRIGKRIVREATGTYTQRGRPPLGSGPKVQQSLRLSPEVLEHFRATGPGWQARIDEVLRRYVEAAGQPGVAETAPKASVAEERMGYAALVQAQAPDLAPAPKKPRRHKPRRKWVAPTVRLLGAGDAEAGFGRQDATALMS